MFLFIRSQLNSTAFSADSAIVSQCVDVTGNQVVSDDITDHPMKKHYNKKPEKYSIQAVDSVGPDK